MTSEQLHSKALTVIAEYFEYLSASVQQDNTHNIGHYSECLRDILDTFYYGGAISGSEHSRYINKLNDFLSKGGE